MQSNKSSIRKPVVAGQFYPGEKSELLKLIDRIYQIEKPNFTSLAYSNRLIGGILPHAGYVFSLHQAIHFFAILENSEQRFNTIIIVNPDHHGNGDAISIDGHSEWKTPLGSVKVDIDLANAMSFPKSMIAQSQEHSTEVIIPLLQHFVNYDFMILPISMRIQNIENSRKLAYEIYERASEMGKKILFIASSDFSHYESPEFGFKQDDKVVKEILNFQGENIFEKVKKYNVSMCGYGPVMSLIEYSKLICEKPEAKILKRGHSGEVYSSNEVVDYISFALYGDHL